MTANIEMSLSQLAKLINIHLKIKYKKANKIVSLRPGILYFCTSF
jgi:hypothetical protein